MNKLRLFFAFLVIFSFGANAQLESGVVIVGGGSFSKTTSDAIESEFLPGINSGLAFHTKISDLFSAEIGLLYSQRGQKYNSGGFSIKEKYNYLSMPLSIKAYLGNFNLSAGFYVSIFQNGKVIIDSDDFDIENNFNLGDGGMLAGVGYQLNEDIEINLRYNHGFQEVYDQGGKNQSITLGIHYLIYRY